MTIARVENECMIMIYDWDPSFVTQECKEIVLFKVSMHGIDIVTVTSGVMGLCYVISLLLENICIGNAHVTTVVMFDIYPFFSHLLRLRDVTFSKLYKKAEGFVSNNQ
ncbi:unnamed protein product [Clavelina lepadiformis]|uniref:Uncharacterized protein n=1 Tax=Clavelina lepadiformis TaxID=159417 RepID=A0ABP0GD61_CLALP